MPDRAECKQKLPFLGLVFCLLLFGNYIILLLYKFGDTAFGYDTGLYRHYIIQYFAQQSNSTLTPFGFHYFSNLLLTLGLSVDAIAYSVYLAIGLGCIALIYIYGETVQDSWTGLFSSILFTTSLTWLDFFGWYYYRNLIALFATILVLILYHRRSVFIILPLVVIGVIHPISLIPIGLTLTIQFLFTPSHRLYLFAVGGISLAVIIGIQYRELLNYLPILQQSFGLSTKLTASAPELSGQFIDLATYLLYSFTYIPFGILGLWRTTKKLPIMITLFITTAVLMLAKIILYRRLFIIIDTVFIIGAAIFLRHFLTTFAYPKIKYALVVVFIICIVGQATLFISRAQTLLPEEEVVAMQYTTLPLGSKIIALSAQSAPWLYGFTPYHIIAPGMLDDNKWNYNEWMEFWATVASTRRIELLSTYTTSSVYIFIGSNDAIISKNIIQDPHMTKHSPYIWKYSINN